MGPTAVGPCLKCGTNSGFNADLVANIRAGRSWTEVKRWRTNANSELYESNGEFNNALGRFAPKATGYYLCNANVALDGFTSFGYSRLLIGVSGKRDVNNGLHAIEGNGGSTNYRSLNVAGTVQINKGQYVSVMVFSSNDNNYYIKSESGFSCHAFTTKMGFHADKLGTQTLRTGWREIVTWRTSGVIGLYNAGNAFNRNNGRFTSKLTGAYFCGAIMRLDGASRSSYFRVNLNMNRQADVNNGFHVIRGNKGSSNYGSLGVAGSVYLKKGSFMSVYVYSRSDNFYRVQTESGFGCHQMGTNIGFHADASATQAFKKGWSRLTKWRTAGNNELYAQGGSPNSQGYYVTPEAGYYMCATQVRIDSAATSRFRLIIAINGQMDIHNGLHVSDGNQGSTNYRSLRIVGSIYLKKGQRTSVHVYSQSDNSYRVQSESGFSCHKFITKLACGSGGGGGGSGTTTPRMADGGMLPPSLPGEGGGGMGGDDGGGGMPPTRDSSGGGMGGGGGFPVVGGRT